MADYGLIQKQRFIAIELERNIIGEECTPPEPHLPPNPPNPPQPPPPTPPTPQPPQPPTPQKNSFSNLVSGFMGAF